VENLEIYKGYNADELIGELKNNRNLSLEQQGLMIIRLMELKNFKRHNDVAEILGFSRSYCSIRIAEAKKKHDTLNTTQNVGRPSHKVIDLDRIIGADIPLRLIIKTGEIPKVEIIRLLNESIKRLKDYQNDI
jgi:hypothetical protein